MENLKPIRLRRPTRLHYGEQTIGGAKGTVRRPEKAGFEAGERCAIVGLGGGSGDGEVDKAENRF